MSKEMRIRNAPVELKLRLESIAHQRGEMLPALLVTALEEWCKGIENAGVVEALIDGQDKRLGKIEAGNTESHRRLGRIENVLREIATAPRPQPEPETQPKQPEKQRPVRPDPFPHASYMMGLEYERQKRRIQR